MIFGAIISLALAGLAAVWVRPVAAPAAPIARGQAAAALTAALPATTVVAVSPTPADSPSATATTPVMAPSVTPSRQPPAATATAGVSARAMLTVTAQPRLIVARLPTARSPATTRLPATPAPARSAGVGVVADIPYVVRSGADPRHTSLDIYRAAGASGLPVLIYVHGGGWSGGDKAEIGAKPAYFTAHGFVFASINYRLMNADAGSVHPAQQAADLAAAVAWVKANIARYGGDGARIFMLGHSAGAHLTALIAADETYLQEVGLGPGVLRGVILLDSAAYDVEQLMHTPEGQAPLFRTAFGDDLGGWRWVSPRAKVEPGKATPPHLLLLSTSGGQRRPAAEGLAAALHGAGVYAHIIDVCGFRNHATINEELGRAGDPATVAVQAFLDMLLRGVATGYGDAEVLRQRP